MLLGTGEHTPKGVSLGQASGEAVAGPGGSDTGGSFGNIRRRSAWTLRRVKAKDPKARWKYLGFSMRHLWREDVVFDGEWFV